MAYKYSDYTVVINFMHCPKHDFGAETHLDGGGTSTLSSHLQPLLMRMLGLSLTLAAQLSGESHKNSDYTAMIAVMY